MRTQQYFSFNYTTGDVFHKKQSFGGRKFFSEIGHSGWPVQGTTNVLICFVTPTACHYSTNLLLLTRVTISYRRCDSCAEIYKTRGIYKTKTHKYKLQGFWRFFEKKKIFTVAILTFWHLDLEIILDRRKFLTRMRRTCSLCFWTQRVHATQPGRTARFEGWDYFWQRRQHH